MVYVFGLICFLPKQGKQQIIYQIILQKTSFLYLKNLSNNILHFCGKFQHSQAKITYIKLIIIYKNTLVMYK